MFEIADTNPADSACYWLFFKIPNTPFNLNKKVQMKNQLSIIRGIFLVGLIGTGLFLNQPAGAQTSCDPPPSGIVSWWRAEGSTVDQVGGDNGIIVGSAGYGPGKVGMGFQFDGNSSGIQLAIATNLWL